MTFSTVLKLSLVSITLLGAGACSRQNIVDNTFDATVFAAKTAAKGAVEVGKLAYKGGKLAVDKARASNAPKSDFAAGTRICENAQGGFYEALETEDGTYACLPVEQQG